MSIQVPDQFKKEEFHRLLNEVLIGKDFEQYKALFRENYKKPKGADA